MNYTERRKQQAAQTERAILQAALELMRTRDFEQVSIREICKQANITTGAFYHHFPSKSALLEHGFAPLDDYMSAAMVGREQDAPDARLWHILATYVQFMEDNRMLIGRYYQRRLSQPDAKPIDASRYTLRAMTACFRQAAQEGLLVPGYTPEWISDFCFRHFRGVVIDWVLHGTSYSLLEKMQADYRLFVTLFHT